MKTLNMGKLKLPLEAVTQTFAGLAKRRVGKTYTFSVMAEEFVAADLPFVALDPTGAWWGLRASANGKGPGLPVVVIGGAHGDIPLNPDEGKLIADVVVDHPGFYVIDMSQTKSNAEQDRFATDFAERLYRRKQESRDPMHLFVDEADSFLPQRPFPGQQRMLGAFEALVRRGGIYGIGVSLISQRAAVVNKNVLSQCEVLIALQTTGPQDRAAIKEWAQGHGTVEQVADLMNTIASLKKGEAWVWSPSWLETFERVQIRERHTFNSSATPKVGERRIEPQRLAEVDIEALREKLAKTLEKAKDNDPALLRKKFDAAMQDNIRLRNEVVKLKTSKPAALSPKEVVTKAKIVRMPMLKASQIKRLESAVAKAKEFSSVFAETVLVLEAAVNDAKKNSVEPGASVLITHRPKFVGAMPPRTDEPVRPSSVEIAKRAGLKVDVLDPRDIPVYDKDFPRAAMRQMSGRSGQDRMIEVMARRFPDAMSRVQIATLSGMSPTSGTFTTYLSRLRNGGLVEEQGRFMVLTQAGQDAGRQWLGKAQSIADVLALWQQNLGGTEWKMLSTLISHGDWTTREDLAQRLGLSYTSGTFTTYLSRLRRNALIEEDGQQLRAGRTLFEPVAA